MTTDSADGIPSLVDSVVTTFENGDRSWENVVGDAVARLDKFFSESEKRTTLTELSKIGLADRKFLYAEAEFIQKVKETWGVTFLEGQPGIAVYLVKAEFAAKPFRLWPYCICRSRISLRQK